MRKNILLIAIVLLFLVLYLVPEKKNESSLEYVEQESTLISAECLNSLERIKFIQGESTQELLRSDSLKLDELLIRRSKWLLKEPFLAPADDEKVNAIVASIRGLKGVYNQSSPKSERQGELGLTPPDGVLILECGSSKEILSIGAKSEVSQNRYYQKEGSGFLYLVKDNFFDATVEILKDIRARKILAFNHLDIHGLEVVDGEKFYSVDKLENGDWSVSADGRKFKGDRTFIEKELKDLVGLNISRRFENPLEILSFTGLEKPKLILNLKIEVEGKVRELVLQFGRGILGDLLAKKQELLLDEAKESYYLKITKDNFIYELERSYISDWLQGANHFRERRPFNGIDASSIKSASLKVGDLSCGLDGPIFVENPRLLSLLKKALDEISFDAFIAPEELSAYQVSGGLSAQFQTDIGILSLSKIRDVVNEIDADKSVVASIWEVGAIGKDSYYGSMLVDKVSLIQNIFKELCVKGKGSERHF